MFSTTLLDGFRASVLEQSLGVYGVHVYQEGRGEAEHRFRADDRAHLYSASKTFTALAIGMAEAEGRLALTDRALDFFPALRAAAASGSEAITVRDLLHMRAGHDAALFSTDARSHELTRDWAEVFFSLPMARAAGVDFLYDNGCTYMLSRIVEAVSGEGLRAYLMPRLFVPLDIPNPQWDTCPRGHALGAVGLHLRTAELGRLGRLLLQDGQWADRALVPSAYTARMVSDIVPTRGFGDAECVPGYGYQVWRCTWPEAYRADGKYGQYSIVLPRERAVVSVSAHNEGCAYEILRAVWREILVRL